MPRRLPPPTAGVYERGSPPLECDAARRRALRLPSSSALACAELPGRAARASSTAATRVLASYLVGGDLDFFQSKSVLHFARRWWEYEGGWSRRWGDQQYWVPALWMMGRNDSASVAKLAACADREWLETTVRTQSTTTTAIFDPAGQ